MDWESMDRYFRRRPTRRRWASVVGFWLLILAILIIAGLLGWWLAGRPMVMIDGI